MTPSGIEPLSPGELANALPNEKDKEKVTDIYTYILLKAYFIWDKRQIFGIEY